MRNGPSRHGIISSYSGWGGGRRLALDEASGEVTVRTRNEPRFRVLDMETDDAGDQNPPLWKDVTLASIIALLLWGMAAAMLV